MYCERKFIIHALLRMHLVYILFQIITVASRCIPKLDKPAIDNITRAVNVDRNALVDGIDDVIKFFNAKEVSRYMENHLNDISLMFDFY